MFQPDWVVTMVLGTIAFLFLKAGDVDTCVALAVVALAAMVCFPLSLIYEQLRKK